MSAPTEVSDEIRRALHEISRVTSGKFPAGAVPHNALHPQSIDRSLEGGADLVDVLRGLAHDLAAVARGNAEILADYERDRGRLSTLNSDLAAFRRVLGLEALLPPGSVVVSLEDLGESLEHGSVTNDAARSRLAAVVAEARS